MLEVCCAICNQSYEGMKDGKPDLLKSSKKLAKAAIESVLKEKQKQSEFKAALLCLSLNVYNKNNAAKIWKDKSLYKKLNKYSGKYQAKTITKIAVFFKKKNDALPGGTMDIVNLWLDYMHTDDLISKFDADKMKM